MNIKKIFKYLIINCLKLFINKKYKFYLLDLKFLGHLINFMYIKSLNSKFNKIIFIPSQLLEKKNPYINYKIFLHAYRSIYKKKISFLSNLIYYIFIKYNENYKKDTKFRIDFQWRPNQINKLSTVNKIFFDPKIKKKNNKKMEYILKSKYILFANRDIAFKNKMHPNLNFSHHDYRNEKLSSYENAVKKYSKYSNHEQFVRFGSIVEKNLQNKIIFNYPKSNFRSENNDLLLMKNCYFYTGTGSGPDMLALNYQRPIVYVNWTHLPNLFCYRGNIVVIFKKLLDLSSKKFLTYSKLMDPNFKKPFSDVPIGLYDKSAEFKKANLKLINNTHEEIFYAMKEMDLFLKKKFSFNLKLQSLFRKKFHKYTGKKVPNDFYISEYFIKKNKKLFL
jgi:putative glycosyltransferase (TIGR04372 family)